MSSATTDFQSTELHRTVYGTKQMNIIDDGPEHFSEQAINLIRATEDVWLEIMDVHHAESFEQAKNFGNSCILNKRIAAEVKDLGAAVPVWDGVSKIIGAAHKEIELLEEVLWIEKRCSVKWESRRN